MSDDPIETVKSIADATKSVSDTTRKGMELGERALAFFAKLVGEDGVGILQDSLFHFRAKNAVALQDKLDKILRERNIQNPNALPLRLAIPFLQSATLEDDGDLQERWARLLANAIDPDFPSPIERCYGDILQSLAPLDCLALEKMALLAHNSKIVLIGSLTTMISVHNLAEVLQVECEPLEISYENLARHGLILKSPPDITRHTDIDEIHYPPCIVTNFGYAFLRACSRFDFDSFETLSET